MSFGAAHMQSQLYGDLQEILGEDYSTIEASLADPLVPGPSPFNIQGEGTSASSSRAADLDPADKDTDC